MAHDAALVRVKDSDQCPTCKGDLERQNTTGDEGDGISFSYCSVCQVEWRQTLSTRGHSRRIIFHQRTDQWTHLALRWGSPSRRLA